MPSEMNKQIYVLDEYITSTKNGIGVFITELLQCLKKMDVDICHVILNVRQPEIRVCSKNGMKKYRYLVFLLVISLITGKW